MLESPCDSEKCKQDGAHLRCGKCKCVYYCSQKCQKDDWKRHKTDCSGLTKQHESFRIKDEQMGDYVGKLEDAAGEECAICYEKLGNIGSPVALKCGHAFCVACMMEHQKYCQEELFCPMCRSQASEHLMQYLYANASYMIRTARFESSPTRKQHFIDLAKSELAKIPAESFSDSQQGSVLQTTQAELLFVDSKYEEAVAKSESIIASMSACTTAAQPDNELVMENLQNIAHCYLAQEDYKSAMSIFQRMFQIADAAPARFTRHIRFVLHEASRCMFAMGKYDDAIAYGQGAVDMNRHYDGVYKHIALAHRAKGDLDAAVRTMKQAVRYETPWDAKNVENCRALLTQLESERDK
mmetsp:Transcript_11697/g.19214  ORF Transcript_11697/g.19214 Transcript_11697/m.19214 type:complete len:354 (+) Transcript_11697:3-1064(+)